MGSSQRQWEKFNSGGPWNGPSSSRRLISRQSSTTSTSTSRSSGLGGDAGIFDKSSDAKTENNRQSITDTLLESMEFLGSHGNLDFADRFYLETIFQRVLDWNNGLPGSSPNDASNMDRHNGAAKTSQKSPGKQDGLRNVDSSRSHAALRDKLERLKQIEKSHPNRYVKPDVETDQISQNERKRRKDLILPEEDDVGFDSRRYYQAPQSRGRRDGIVREMSHSSRDTSSSSKGVSDNSTSRRSYLSSMSSVSMENGSLRGSPQESAVPQAANPTGGATLMPHFSNIPAASFESTASPSDPYLFTQPYTTSHAERVLMGLGFGAAEGFLPERFLKDWYTKISKAQMESKMASVAELKSQASCDHTAALSHRTMSRDGHPPRENTIYNGGPPPQMHPSSYSSPRLHEATNQLPTSNYQDSKLQRLKEYISAYSNNMSIDDDQEMRIKQFAMSRQKSLPLCLENLTKVGEDGTRYLCIDPFDKEAKLQMFISDALSSSETGSNSDISNKSRKHHGHENAKSSSERNERNKSPHRSQQQTKNQNSEQNIDKRVKETKQDDRITSYNLRGKQSDSSTKSQLNKLQIGRASSVSNDGVSDAPSLRQRNKEPATNHFVKRAVRSPTRQAAVDSGDAIYRDEARSHSKGNTSLLVKNLEMNPERGRDSSNTAQRQLQNRDSTISKDSIEVADIMQNQSNKDHKGPPLKSALKHVEPAMVSIVLEDIDENEGRCSADLLSVTQEGIHLVIPLSALSPIPLSPITVIEVGLDNQQDSLDTEGTYSSKDTDDDNLTFHPDEYGPSKHSRSGRRSSLCNLVPKPEHLQRRRSTGIITPIPCHLSLTQLSRSTKDGRSGRRLSLEVPVIPEIRQMLDKKKLLHPNQSKDSLTEPKIGREKRRASFSEAEPIIINDVLDRERNISPLLGKQFSSPHDSFEKVENSTGDLDIPEIQFSNPHHTDKNIYCNTQENRDSSNCGTAPSKSDERQSASRTGLCSIDYEKNKDTHTIPSTITITRNENLPHIDWDPASEFNIGGTRSCESSPGSAKSAFRVAGKRTQENSPASCNGYFSETDAEEFPINVNVNLNTRPISSIAKNLHGENTDGDSETNTPVTEMPSDSLEGMSSSPTLHFSDQNHAFPISVHGINNKNHVFPIPVHGINNKVTSQMISRAVEANDSTFPYLLLNSQNSSIQNNSPDYYYAADRSVQCDLIGPGYQSEASHVSDELINKCTQTDICKYEISCQTTDTFYFVQDDCQISNQTDQTQNKAVNTIVCLIGREHGNEYTQRSASKNVPKDYNDIDETIQEIDDELSYIENKNYQRSLRNRALQSNRKRTEIERSRIMALSGVLGERKFDERDYSHNSTNRGKEKPAEKEDGVIKRFAPSTWEDATDWATTLEKIKFVDDKSRGRIIDNDTGDIMYGRYVDNNSGDITYGRSVENNSRDITYGRSVDNKSGDITYGRSVDNKSWDKTYGRSVDNNSGDITCGRTVDNKSGDMTYGRSVDNNSRKITYGRPVANNAGDITNGRPVAKNSGDITYGRSLDNNSGDRTYGRSVKNNSGDTTYGRSVDNNSGDRTYGRSVDNKSQGIACRGDSDNKTQKLYKNKNMNGASNSSSDTSLNPPDYGKEFEENVRHDLGNKEMFTPYYRKDCHLAELSKFTHTFKEDRRGFIRLDHAENNNKIRASDFRDESSNSYSNVDGLIHSEWRQFRNTDNKIFTGGDNWWKRTREIDIKNKDNFLKYSAKNYNKSSPKSFYPKRRAIPYSQPFRITNTKLKGNTEAATVLSEPLIAVTKGINTEIMIYPTSLNSNNDATNSSPMIGKEHLDRSHSKLSRLKYKQSFLQSSTSSVDLETDFVNAGKPIGMLNPLQSDIKMILHSEEVNSSMVDTHEVAYSEGDHHPATPGATHSGVNPSQIGTLGITLSGVNPLQIDTHEIMHSDVNHSQIDTPEIKSKGENRSLQSTPGITNSGLNPLESKAQSITYSEVNYQRADNHVMRHSGEHATNTQEVSQHVNPAGTDEHTNYLLTLSQKNTQISSLIDPLYIIPPIIISDEQNQDQQRFSATVNATQIELQIEEDYDNTDSTPVICIPNLDVLYKEPNAQMSTFASNISEAVVEETFTSNISETENRQCLPNIPDIKLETNARWTTPEIVITPIKSFQADLLKVPGSPDHLFRKAKFPSSTGSLSSSSSTSPLASPKPQILEKVAQVRGGNKEQLASNGGVTGTHTFTFTVDELPPLSDVDKSEEAKHGEDNREFDVKSEVQGSIIGSLTKFSHESSMEQFLDQFSDASTLPGLSNDSQTGDHLEEAGFHADCDLTNVVYSENPNGDSVDTISPHTPVVDAQDLTVNNSLQKCQTLTNWSSSIGAVESVDINSNESEAGSNENEDLDDMEVLVEGSRKTRLDSDSSYSDAVLDMSDSFSDSSFYGASNKANSAHTHLLASGNDADDLLQVSDFGGISPTPSQTRAYSEDISSFTAENIIHGSSRDEETLSRSSIRSPLRDLPLEPLKCDIDSDDDLDPESELKLREQLRQNRRGSKHSLKDNSGIGPNFPVEERSSSVQHLANNKYGKDKTYTIVPECTINILEPSKSYTDKSSGDECDQEISKINLNRPIIRKLTKMSSDPVDKDLYCRSMSMTTMKENTANLEQNNSLVEETFTNVHIKCELDNEHDHIECELDNEHDTVDERSSISENNIFVHSDAVKIFTETPLETLRRPSESALASSCKSETQQRNYEELCMGTKGNIGSNIINDNFHGKLDVARVLDVEYDNEDPENGRLGRGQNSVDVPFTDIMDELEMIALFNKIDNYDRSMNIFVDYSSESSSEEFKLSQISEEETQSEDTTSECSGQHLWHVRNRFVVVAQDTQETTIDNVSSKVVNENDSCSDGGSNNKDTYLLSVTNSEMISQEPREDDISWENDLILTSDSNGKKKESSQCIQADFYEKALQNNLSNEEFTVTVPNDASESGINQYLPRMFDNSSILNNNEDLPLRKSLLSDYNINMPKLYTGQIKQLIRGSGGDNLSTTEQSTPAYETQVLETTLDLAGNIITRIRSSRALRIKYFNSSKSSHEEATVDNMFGSIEGPKHTSSAVIAVGDYRSEKEMKNMSLPASRTEQQEGDTLNMISLDSKITRNNSTHNVEIEDGGEGLSILNQSNSFQCVIHQAIIAGGKNKKMHSNLEDTTSQVDTLVPQEDNIDEVPSQLLADSEDTSNVECNETGSSLAKMKLHKLLRSVFRDQVVDTSEDIPNYCDADIHAPEASTTEDLKNTVRSMFLIDDVGTSVESPTFHDRSRSSSSCSIQEKLEDTQPVDCYDGTESAELASGENTRFNNVCKQKNSPNRQENYEEDVLNSVIVSTEAAYPSTVDRSVIVSTEGAYPSIVDRSVIVSTEGAYPSIVVGSVVLSTQDGYRSTGDGEDNKDYRRETISSSVIDMKDHALSMLHIATSETESPSKNNSQFIDTSSQVKSTNIEDLKQKVSIMFQIDTANSENQSMNSSEFINKSNHMNSTIREEDLTQNERSIFNIDTADLNNFSNKRSQFNDNSSIGSMSREDLKHNVRSMFLIGTTDSVSILTARSKPIDAHSHASKSLTLKDLAPQIGASNETISSLSTYSEEANSESAEMSLSTVQSVRDNVSSIDLNTTADSSDNRSVDEYRSDSSLNSQTKSIDETGVIDDIKSRVRAMFLISHKSGQTSSESSIAHSSDTRSTSGEISSRPTAMNRVKVTTMFSENKESVRKSFCTSVSQDSEEMKGHLLEDESKRLKNEGMHNIRTQMYNKGKRNISNIVGGKENTNVRVLRGRNSLLRLHEQANVSSPTGSDSDPELVTALTNQGDYDMRKRDLALGRISSDNDEGEFGLSKDVHKYIPSSQDHTASGVSCSVQICNEDLVSNSSSLIQNRVGTFSSSEDLSPKVVIEKPRDDNFSMKLPVKECEFTAVLAVSTADGTPHHVSASNDYQPQSQDMLESRPSPDDIKPIIKRLSARPNSSSSLWLRRNRQSNFLSPDRPVHQTLQYSDMPQHDQYSDIPQEDQYNDTPQQDQYIRQHDDSHPELSYLDIVSKLSRQQETPKILPIKQHDVEFILSPPDSTRKSSKAKTVTFSSIISTD